MVPPPHASGSSRAGGRSTCAGAGSRTALTAQSPSVPGGVPGLAALQFVSATRGWAAGSGRILATSDGGATWTRQYAGPARLYEVDFTDAAHGWAVGTSALLTTVDGGRTWTSLPEPCGLADSVHFVTPRLGYAVSGAPAVRLDAGTPVAAGSPDGGRLLVTRDGGRTWNPAAGAPPAVQSACFTSPSAGYLGTPGRVWRTTDGGAHWAVSFAEPPANGGGAQPGQPALRAARPDATALECAGPGAWTLFLGAGALLGHAPYLAYATRDGRNWHVLFGESYAESALRPGIRAPDGPGSYPGPFSAISGGSAAYVGWTPPAGLGAAPLDLVTGGTSVARMGNVSGITQPYAASFASPSRGWVAGADQASPARPGPDVIEATADGGRTWTRQMALPPG